MNRAQLGDLVLRVVGYQFPEEARGWDADWLVCEAEIGPTCQPLTLTGRELGRLLADAWAFGRGATTELAFEAWEEQLVIGLAAGDDGVRGRAEIRAQDPAVVTATTDVVCERADVQAWAAQLAQVVRRYPSRLD